MSHIGHSHQNSRMLHGTRSPNCWFMFWSYKPFVSEFGVASRPLTLNCWS